MRAAWSTMMMMDEVDISLVGEEAIRPMRRSEYELLTAQGCFEDEKVELLFGMVVKMSPIDPAHSESVYRVAEFLRAALQGRAQVRVQAPFAASEWSEPEPDVFVIPVGEYWTAHPDRASLVVEVARTSLRRDRGPKAMLYATSNVEEYWIVDHVNGVVEVFRDPRGGTWLARSTHGRGETITPQRFPDVTIAVSDILPPVG
jgi:Uma2 family endonuclease